MSKRLVAHTAAAMALAGNGSAAADPCRLQRLMVDGCEQVVLENAYVSLTFAPSRGGACTSFLYKATGDGWVGGAPGTRLLRDQVWQQKSGGDWLDAPYKLTVLEDAPDGVSIELFAPGRSAALEFSGFRKTITLTRDSSAVRIRYAFEVRNEAMSPQTAGLWFTNEISLPGRKIACHCPVADGVKTVLYDPLAPPVEYFEYDPPRGWLGLVADDGSGLGVRMEYSRLMCLYQRQDEAMSIGPGAAAVTGTVSYEVHAVSGSRRDDQTALPSFTGPAMEPGSPRTGDSADRFGSTRIAARDAEIPLRMDVVTPHVEWGKPYYKGKTRALFLMDYGNAREVVELAQRMDLDYDAPFFAYGMDPYYVGDAYTKLTRAEMLETIGKYLKKKGYDVIPEPDPALASRYVRRHSQPRRGEGPDEADRWPGRRHGP